jgi:hypothetical protein
MVPELIKELERLIHFYKDISPEICKLPWTMKDQQRMELHVKEESDFDTANFKSKTLTNKSLCRHYTLSGSHLLVCGQKEPSRKLLEAMATVLMMMGRKTYTICWFMSSAKRSFPPKGQPIGPQHINGGYCYPCRHDTIVIYREEDALRVLIHELQHATCMDRKAELSELEAETEAWAELIYAAIAALFHKISVATAWQKQLSWSRAQNSRLAAHHKVRGPSDYAWRYTVGKEAIWIGLGLGIQSGSTPVQAQSLQLGCPELDIS